MRVKERTVGFFGKTESKLAQERADKLAKLRFEAEAAAIKNQTKAEKDAIMARKLEQKRQKVETKNSKTAAKAALLHEKNESKVIKANAKATGFWARRAARKASREATSGGEAEKPKGFLSKVATNLTAPAAARVKAASESASKKTGEVLAHPYAAASTAVTELRQRAREVRLQRAESED